MGSSTKKTTGPDSASRQERKAKKRKLEAAVPDLPGDNCSDTEIVDDGEKEGNNKKRKRDTDDEEKWLKKKEKKTKKTKKEEGVDAMEGAEVDEKAAKNERKKGTKGSTIESAAIEEVVVKGESAAEIGEDVPKKSKKERKAERKAKEAANKTASAPTIEATEINGDTELTTAEKEKPKKNNRNRDKKRKANADGETKAVRFIIFVGNLPFSATTASVTKHFASVKPKSVRHLTQKYNPQKSKGCAFVEFDGYDHMKTCLKLFHHSSFDDGISPPRKINVELTAGGGGNTTDRRQKITEKNKKLDEQRYRRIQEEEKAKFAKKKAGGADESGIHPSRRRIVPGA